MKSIKTLILATAITAFASMPKIVNAAEDTYVCGQSYGQPVVCGVKVPEEKPIIVEAGLAEDLRVLGAAFLAGALMLYIKAKRTKPSFQLEPIVLVGEND